MTNFWGRYVPSVVLFVGMTVVIVVKARQLRQTYPGSPGARAVTLFSYLGITGSAFGIIYGVIYLIT